MSVCVCVCVCVFVCCYMFAMLTSGTTGDLNMDSKLWVSDKHSVHYVSTQCVNLYTVVHAPLRLVRL